GGGKAAPPRRQALLKGKQMRALDSLLGRSRRHSREPLQARLGVERLEERELLTAVPSLAGTTLTVLGGPTNHRISILRHAATDQLVVFASGRVVGAFASAAVTDISVNGGGGNDFIFVGPGVTQNAVLTAGTPTARFTAGCDFLVYLGSGNAVLIGGPGDDRLIGGGGNDILIGGGGNDILFGGGGFNV